MVMPCDIRDSARDRTGLDRGERIFCFFSLRPPLPVSTFVYYQLFGRRSDP